MTTATLTTEAVAANIKESVRKAAVHQRAASDREPELTATAAGRKVWQRVWRTSAIAACQVHYRIMFDDEAKAELSKVWRKSFGRLPSIS